MTRPTFKDYTYENPILLEAKRFGRRFMGISRGKGGHAAYLVLTSVIYLLLLVMALCYREAFSAGGMIVFQTILMCVLVPSIAQNAVAGEREKRTWELLVAAPIYRSQIVIGKFISILIVLTVLTIAFIPLIAVSVSPTSETFPGVMLAECISLGFGASLAALGTFISAITSRSLACQSMIYVATFIWLVVYPSLISAISSLQFMNGSSTHTDGLYFMQPISAIFTVSATNHGIFDPTNSSDLSAYSWPVQGVFYSALIALFLFCAVVAVNRSQSDSGGS